jgi:hypothetical protein
VQILELVSIYILIIVLLLGVPAFLGVVYLIRNKSERGRPVQGREAPPAPPPGARNLDPVTLDRNPEMPKQPGATS